MAVRDGTKRFLEEQGKSAERLLWSTYTNAILLLCSMTALHLVSKLALGRALPGFPALELRLLILPALKGSAQSASILIAQLLRCRSGSIYFLALDYVPSMGMAFSADVVLFVFYPCGFLFFTLRFLRAHVAKTSAESRVPIPPVVRYVAFHPRHHESKVKIAPGAQVEGGKPSRALHVTKTSGTDAASSLRRMSKAVAASCSHVRPHPMKVEEGMWMSNPLFNGMFGSLYSAYNPENWWFFVLDALTDVAQLFASSLISRDDDAPALRGSVGDTLSGLMQPCVVMMFRMLLLGTLCLRRPYASFVHGRRHVMILVQQIGSTMLFLIGAIFPSLMPEICIGVLFTQIAVPLLVVLLPQLPPLPTTDESIDQWLRWLCSPMSHVRFRFLINLLTLLEKLYPIVEVAEEQVEALMSKFGGRQEDNTASEDKSHEKQRASAEDVLASENEAELHALMRDPWLEACLSRSHGWFQRHLWLKRYNRGSNEAEHGAHALNSAMETSTATGPRDVHHRVAFEIVSRLDSRRYESIEAVRHRRRSWVHRLAFWLNDHPVELHKVAEKLLDDRITPNELAARAALMLGVAPLDVAQETDKAVICRLVIRVARVRSIAHQQSGDQSTVGSATRASRMPKQSRIHPAAPCTDFAGTSHQLRSAPVYGQGHPCDDELISRRLIVLSRLHVCCPFIARL